MVRRVMVPDSIRCAFFKIPKANDISGLKSAFLCIYTVNAPAMRALQKTFTHLDNFWFSYFLGKFLFFLLFPIFQRKFLFLSIYNFYGNFLPHFMQHDIKKKRKKDSFCTKYSQEFSHLGSLGSTTCVCTRIKLLCSLWWIRMAVGGKLGGLFRI